MLITRFILAAVALAFSASLIAAEPGFVECLEYENDAERLACYDRHARRLVERPAGSGERHEEQAAKPANEQFGLRPDEPEEIEAVVAEIVSGRRGVRTFELENGQAWRENTYQRALRVREGDTVTIKRGAFGSYRLHGPGNRYTRVERIR